MNNTDYYITFTTLQDDDIFEHTVPVRSIVELLKGSNPKNKYKEFVIKLNVQGLLITHEVEEKEFMRIMKTLNNIKLDDRLTGDNKNGII